MPATTSAAIRESPPRKSCTRIPRPRRFCERDSNISTSDVEEVCITGPVRDSAASWGANSPEQVVLVGAQLAEQANFQIEDVVGSVPICATGPGTRRSPPAASAERIPLAVRVEVPWPERKADLTRPTSTRNLPAPSLPRQQPLGGTRHPFEIAAQVVRLSKARSAAWRLRVKFDDSGVGGTCAAAGMTAYQSVAI